MVPIMSFGQSIGPVLLLVLLLGLFKSLSLEYGSRICSSHWRMPLTKGNVEKEDGKLRVFQSGAGLSEERCGGRRGPQQMVLGFFVLQGCKGRSFLSSWLGFLSLS